MEKQTKTKIFRIVKRIGIMLVFATIGFFIAGIAGIFIGLIAGTGISSPGIIGAISDGPFWSRR